MNTKNKNHKLPEDVSPLVKTDCGIRERLTPTRSHPVLLKAILMAVVCVSLSGCYAIRKTGCDWFSYDCDSSMIPVDPQPPVDPWACTNSKDIFDGAGGFLWKPHSERTGAVVLLAPAEYKDAQVRVFGDEMQRLDDRITTRDCCSHNDGRMHFYFYHNAAYWTEFEPLLVKFQFPDGRVDCRAVASGSTRQDRKSEPIPRSE